MRTLWDTLRIIAQIAFRNLFASRTKTIVVGGIILFGAFLVVFGTSLLDSVDASMKSSIVGSVAGDIQVYSSDSEEELDVMGGFNIEGADLEPLSRFEDVKRVLMDVPNVKQVVPMGISGAFVASGNTIDLVLEDLRESSRRREAGTLEDERAYEAQKSHVQQIVRILKGDLRNVRDLLSDAVVSDDSVAALERTSGEAFWKAFDEDPLNSLEFLENRVAPMATDADLIALRYVGTDPAAFAQAFDRFKIVKGEAIPAGKPGFLFSDYVYENQIKMKTARSLDKIKLARDNTGTRIADDDELKRLVRENTSQVKELLLQLDERKSAAFREELQGFLGSDEQNVGALLSSFFDTTDANFDERYAFFYEKLAPSLNLYRVPVGSTLTIKAFTKSGYVQSVNLHVYGTFAFEGLENSPQVGSLNLMDLVSFRNLYGFLTEERAEEIEALRAEIGAREVSRENAEAALFGAPAEAEAAGADAPEPADASPNDAPAGGEPSQDVSSRAQLDASLADLADRRREADRERSFDPADLQRGIFLNAAVLLEDPAKIDATLEAIEAAGAAHDLPLKAVTWQEASGITGQFVTLMRLVLIAAVLIIFVVALVIISNALVMATLERVQEIGTLRALGAQRRFVLAMLIMESVLIGLVFGIGGAVLGAALVGWLGAAGLPATNDVMTFFFSGNRLYPSLGGSNLVLSLFTVVLVSVLSCIYPAWIALRVTPRQAMQSEE